MTIEERIVYEFYQWEKRYRGYQLFPYPVNLEVPYTPFERKISSPPKKIDDGLVKPWWSKILSKRKEAGTSEIDQEIIFPDPNKYNYQDDLHVIRITVPRNSDIQYIASKEFLICLSLTQEKVSFEIICTGESINVQIVCSPHDVVWIESHLAMYFPEFNYHSGQQFDIPFNPDGPQIAAIDFGIEQEAMLPITTTETFHKDSLASLFALFESIPAKASCMFQICFKGVDAPLRRDFLIAAHDGNGEAFFSDFPEISNETYKKVESDLVSVTMRLAVQGTNDEHTTFIAHQLINSLNQTSKGTYNQLIPLGNERYDYDNHIRNILYRTSNRCGFALSINELITFVHFPTKQINSEKFFGKDKKTKIVPLEFRDQKYTLGINLHEGKEYTVGTNDESRLRHTHILGVTGVGKSTLLVNMALNDIAIGNGCAIFDPHGDIVEDILNRIPESRKDDVILIDPSDIDFPIGFNLLHAETEAEKLVLSSDLVSAFREHSTSWGDTMTSVLSNAIDTFLESTTGGTLIELKRFLIDDTFRKDFLINVSDTSLKYYWTHEYHLVKKRISPLLTRIDTFLRPKIIRLMMAQKSGVNFKNAVQSKKIILFKLSMGLIGEENAFLLGSLFLSKINQIALGRQSLKKEDRHPYYLYLDECQHFMSPSIGMMLSGVRKYGIGLILAHQDISQIHHLPTQNSILSNPFIRIYFRLGDSDAKRIEQGLSYFEANDLTKLGRGEAIVRLGGSENDCNINTHKLSEVQNEDIRDTIIQNNHLNYAKKRADVECDIDNFLRLKTNGNADSGKNTHSTLKPNEDIRSQPIYQAPSTKTTIPPPEKSSATTSTKREILEEDKQKIFKQAERKEELKLHRKTQFMVKKLGQQYGFISSIEHEIHQGKRIDVSLIKGSLKIACEISVTNSIDYEVQNIHKCFQASYLMVLMISENDKHRENIQKRAKEVLDPRDFKRTKFISSDQVESIIKATIPKSKVKTEVIKGFRVKTEYDNRINENDAQLRKDIERIIRKRR